MCYYHLGAAKEVLERSVRVDEKKVEFDYVYVHSNSQ